MDKEFYNPDIKIVRFKDGMDIICHCIFDKKDYSYDVTSPMMFDITPKGQLVLQHWLPIAVMKEKRVRIRDEDVLCVYEPSSNFAEYYSTTIDKMNSVIESNKEENGMEEIIEALAELQSNGVPIH